MKTKKTACPHCGSSDPKFQESNGERPTSRDYTLLCVARVKPADWSFSHEPTPEEIGPDGKVTCGMQWEPNDGYYDDDAEVVS